MVLTEICCDITLIVVFNGCKGHTWLYNKSKEFKEFLSISTLALEYISIITAATFSCFG